MTWSDIPFRPTQRVLRQFAACWLVIFGVMGVSLLFKHRPHPGLTLLVAAVLVGVPGLIKPSWMRPIFVTWMVLAFPIGWTVSFLMLLILYFLVITPISLILRIGGRDALGRRVNPGCATFWQPKRGPVDVKQYFRQY